MDTSSKGTPKKSKIVSTKKVKIVAESPKSPKSKLAKTPIKKRISKVAKSPDAEKKATKPKAILTKKKKVKTSTVEKVPILPASIEKQLSRRQKKRLLHKIRMKLRLLGKTELTILDMNDKTVQETVSEILTDYNKNNAEKSQKKSKKVMKKIEETKMEVDNVIKAKKSPKIKKQKVGTTAVGKSPKKNKSKKVK